MKGYLSAKEVAHKWNISVRWVNQYIQDGRVPGAERFGKSWAIPEDAVKPEKQKPGVKRATQTAE
jgi:excisionase family DNA binding protein